MLINSFCFVGYFEEAYNVPDEESIPPHYAPLLEHFPVTDRVMEDFNDSNGDWAML